MMTLQTSDYYIWHDELKGITGFGTLKDYLSMKKKHPHPEDLEIICEAGKKKAVCEEIIKALNKGM